MMSNHFISRAQAEEMIGRFQLEKENILIPSMEGKGILFTSETFNRACFDTVLAESGAAGLRFYLGMNAALETRLIAVAVDADDNDILPAAAAAANISAAAGDPKIIEEGIRCPTNCPRGNSLV